MSKIFWEILARLGFWIPCNKYMPDPKYWDWVLIGYHEKGLSYYYIPTVAEYSHTKRRWHDKSDDGSDDFLNNICEVTHWHRLPRKLKVKGNVQ